MLDVFYPKLPFSLQSLTSGNYLLRVSLLYVTFLAPTSDYHLIYTYSAISESLNIRNIRVTRIEEKLLIIKYFLLVDTIRNLVRTVWRLTILEQGCNRLKEIFENYPELAPQVVSFALF